MSETDVTKLVANRAASSQSVQQALAVHGTEAASALSTLMFPDGEPRRLTVADFLHAAGKLLESRTSAMVAAERKLVAEYADDAPYRLARDNARASLRSSLVSIASSVEGAFGAAALGHYHLDVALPTDDEQLKIHATTVHTALRNGAPHESAKKGRKLDFAELAAEVQTHLGDFTKALADVKREDREAQQALSARDAAIAAFEPVYAGVASICSGALELVGQAKLAHHVKPTQHRRAGIEATPASPPASDPAKSA